MTENQDTTRKETEEESHTMLNVRVKQEECVEGMTMPSIWGKMKET